MASTPSTATPPYNLPAPRPRIETARAVGIIGCGVVGEHLCHDLVPTGWPVCLYDTHETAMVRVLTSTQSTAVTATAALVVIASRCHTLFLTLPTPAAAAGHDLGTVESTLAFLLSFGFKGPVILKSTVCPGTTDRLAAQYQPLRLFHVPEFLSSRTAHLDTALPMQPYVLLGVPHKTPAALTDRVRTLLEHVARGRQRVMTVRARESEATKLFCNVFYAAKVQLFNEFYHLAQHYGFAYETVRHLMIQQGWVHPMHTEVPGPDGQLGFGGACLPKDTLALSRWVVHKDVDGQASAAYSCPLLRTLGEVATPSPPSPPSMLSLPSA